MSERFIFSDIYKMSMDELLSFVNKVILNIGIPLVINSKEKYISICANDIQTSEFIQFYILQRFIYFIGSNAILNVLYIIFVKQMEASVMRIVF